MSHQERALSQDKVLKIQDRFKRQVSQSRLVSLRQNEEAVHLFIEKMLSDEQRLFKAQSGPDEAKNFVQGLIDTVGKKSYENKELIESAIYAVALNSNLTEQTYRVNSAAYKGLAGVAGAVTGLVLFPVFLAVTILSALIARNPSGSFAEKTWVRFINTVSAFICKLFSLQPCKEKHFKNIFKQPKQDARATVGSLNVPVNVQPIEIPYANLLRRASVDQGGMEASFSLAAV